MDQHRDDFRPSPYADLSGGPYLDLVLPHYPGNPVLLDLATRERQRVEIFFGKVRYPEPALGQVRDLYDGALAYTDDNLARLLRALSEIGLEESTVVVVAGDHGEALGDHGLYFTHDFTLYDEVLRVPLVVRMPGRVAPGTTVAQQVRLMDIAPTLLELADLDVPEDMEGVSLVALLENRTLPYLKAFAESAPKQPLFSGQPRVFYDGNKYRWKKWGSFSERH
jgi:arylsulfatase A-like enzyme